MFLGKVKCLKGQITILCWESHFDQINASGIVSICDAIDNITKGDTDQSRKIHMTSWSSICSTKSHGGLGLRKTNINNQASMVKLGWRLKIPLKYNWGSYILLQKNVNQPSSNMWNGLTATWPNVR
ncbi:putative ribonuclease H protein, partial [Mucuna pruriens]